jgi:hypothetical protein
MKRLVLLITMLLTAPLPLFADLDSKSAMYLAGTISSLKIGTVGKITTAEKVFTFEFAGGKLVIPYNQIMSMVDTRKTRFIGPVPANKGTHYLTISFEDQDKSQKVAMFQLGKDIAQEVLGDLEAKTGEKIQRILE